MFSIIIPAYNSSGTIVQCLNSVKSQLFTEFEVIVVSDGSTDETERICLECICGDDRFKFVHRNHEGVSSSRQYGFKHSRKKWVVFLDSDDTLPEDALLKFAEVINSDSHVEMIIGNCSAVCCERIQYMDFSFSTQEEYVKEFLSFGIVPTTLWGKAISRNLIRNNNIYFKTGVDICEDYHFLSRVLLKSECIRFVRASLYNWTAMNSDGLSRKKMCDFYTKSVVLNEVFEYYLKNRGEKFLDVINRAMFVMYMMFLGSKFYALPNVTTPIYDIKNLSIKGLSFCEKVAFLLCRFGLERLSVMAFMSSH